MRFIPSKDYYAVSNPQVGNSRHADASKYMKKRDNSNEDERLEVEQTELEKYGEN